MNYTPVGTKLFAKALETMITDVSTYNNDVLLDIADSIKRDETGEKLSDDELEFLTKLMTCVHVTHAYPDTIVITFKEKHIHKG